MPGSGAGRNLELKARDGEPEDSLEACRKLGAVDCGVLWQRDTYLNTPRGSLKLRVQRPGHCQLIHCQRADEPGERESHYRIMEVSDPETTRAFLSESLGVQATVTKRRRLFLWRSVRIHLDDVEGLGRFIELEAVTPPESDLSAEHELIGELRRRLAIADARLVAGGYATLLVATSPTAAANSADPDGFDQALVGQSLNAARIEQPGPGHLGIGRPRA